MILISIYLDNSKCKEVDFRQPWLGNPGSGGTEFLMSSFAYYFKKHTSLNQIRFITYAHSTVLLPEGYETYEFKTEVAAINHFKSIGGDIFITRPTQISDYHSVLDCLEKNCLMTIFWFHSTVNQWNDRILRAKYNRVVLCVGRTQYNLLPSKLKSISTYIFNGFDAANYTPISILNTQQKVVYLGSLVPSKGFHIIAKVWRQLLSRFPSAELIVLGSGNLYDSGAALGQYGIAQSDYEKDFMHYLLDSEGKLLQSVKFLGKVGVDKIEHIRTASVGIVNPTASTENCPGSAIEFQACGIPVVSRNAFGLKDTVLNQNTGLLGETEEDLIENITWMLSSPKHAQIMGAKGAEFVGEQFSYIKVIKEWDRLFLSLYKRQIQMFIFRKRFRNFIFSRKNFLKTGFHKLGDSL